METNLNEKTDTHANDTCTCHSHSACGCGCHCHEEKENSIRDFVMPALSFSLLIAGIIMNHAGTSWFAAQSVKLIWFLVAFLPVGLPVIQEAWEAVREKDFFSEFTLMLIASIGAFCIGEYPEAVAVMLFYTIGETLQHRAVDKASRNISRLLDVRPERTSVLRNGNYTDISPKEVRTGELIEIKPGERIPLDGVLTEEEATFDTSALTGESMPRTIAKGEEVLAGMISAGQTVHLQVVRPYESSTLARILALVKDASDLYYLDAQAVAALERMGDKSAENALRAIDESRGRGLEPVIRDVAESGKPFLGICLGLQLLFERSDEAPGVDGLGILKGEILRIPDKEGLKIPHMGWNSLHLENDGRLFHGIDEGAYVYFVHSYYLKAADESIVKASTEYSTHIHASVEKDNVFACQFHPEKSSGVGIRILKNFVELQA